MTQQIRPFDMATMPSSPARHGSATRTWSRPGEMLEKRPARFQGMTGNYAPAPGVNGACSFHEAHFVAHFSRVRNRGIETPFATEGVDEGHASSQLPQAPQAEDLRNFASAARLPPVGGPGQQPLPTQALSRVDSVGFARAVANHVKSRADAGNGNILSWE